MIVRFPPFLLFIYLSIFKGQDVMLTRKIAYGDLNLFCTCPPVEDTTGNN